MAPAARALAGAPGGAGVGPAGRRRVQARSHKTIVHVAPVTAGCLGKRFAAELSLTDEALPYLADALGLRTPAPSA